MNLIKIDKLNKGRLTKILKTFFPDNKVIKIKKSGLVVFKKHRFSFKRSVTTITDLAIRQIPYILGKKLKASPEIVDKLWDIFLMYWDPQIKCGDYEKQAQKKEWLPILRKAPSFKEMTGEKTHSPNTLFEIYYGVLHNKQIEERTALQEVNYADIYQVL